MAYVPLSLIYIHQTHFLAEVMGRLDHLVEAVYERFKDRYFPGESTLPSSMFVPKPWLTQALLQRSLLIFRVSSTCHVSTSETCC